jgi:hypothetical protein
MRAVAAPSRTGLVALVLLAAALSGCLGAVDDLVDDDALSAADADGGDAQEASDDTEQELEDVEAALDAGEPTANLDVMGTWRNGNTEEADNHGDRLLVDRGSHAVILDVSNPDEPEKVGEIRDVPTVLDVKWGPDGRYAFLSDDEVGSEEPVAGTGPATGGIYVFDVSDPGSPERVTYEGVGPTRGPHMIHVHETDGGEVLVASAAGRSVVLHTWDADSGSLEEVGRYAPGQLAQDRDPNQVGPLYNPQGWLHDMIIEEGPDGERLMYVAAWDAGLRVVDVSDPSSPEEVGHWADFSDGEAGNLHTVATEWIGDRRVTVGAVEVGFGVVGGTLYAQGEETSVTYVWDTTDPANPELLGRWTNPRDPTSGRDLVPGEEVTSTHNLQLEDGRLYQAHYDLGVWVVDLSTPANRSDPVTVGYHDDGNMHTWDVVLQDGVMYSSGEVGVKAMNFALDLVPGGPTSDV